MTENHHITIFWIKVINYEVLTWCYQRGPMRNAENGARGCKIFGDLLAEWICMAPTCSEQFRTHVSHLFDDFYWFLMRGSDRQPAEADPTELFHRRRARAHRRVAALQWSGHGCGPPPPRREILAFQAMLALKSQSIAFIRFLSCHCRDVGKKINCPPFISIHTKPSWQFGCIVVSYLSVLQFRSLHSQPAVFECSHGSLPKILSLICLIGSAFPASFSLPLYALALFLKVSSKTSCGTTSKTTLTDPCRYRAKRCFCISSLALAVAESCIGTFWHEHTLFVRKLWKNLKKSRSCLIVARPWNCIQSRWGLPIFLFHLRLLYTKCLHMILYASIHSHVLCEHWSTILWLTNHQASWFKHPLPLTFFKQVQAKWP